jgi:hypothetical protein
VEASQVYISQGRVGGLRNDAVCTLKFFQVVCLSHHLTVGEGVGVIQMVDGCMSYQSNAFALRLIQYGWPPCNKGWDHSGSNGTETSCPAHNKIVL